MIMSRSCRVLAYFLGVIMLMSCGSALQLDRQHKRQSSAKFRPESSLDYVIKLEPYLDNKGSLVLPGQKLRHWSGRSLIGSSRYDLVPLD